nr:hypothetical protein [Variovorax boronicumulans]
MEYGTHLDHARLHEQCHEHLVLIDLLAKGQRMEAAQCLREHLSTALARKVGPGRTTDTQNESG